MWTDFRIALRTLARAPLFTAVAILSLAIGIGANTAIFSLIDQVLVRNLRVADPARLVVFHASDSFPGHSHSDSDESVFSYPIYKDLRDRSQVFDGVVARSSAAGQRVGRRHQRTRPAPRWCRETCSRCSASQPALGRSIAPCRRPAPDASPVVSSAHAYWTRTVRRQSPPSSAAGSWSTAIRWSSSASCRRRFAGSSSATCRDLFVPIAMKREITPTWFALDDRRTSWLNLFARLKPGGPSGAGAGEDARALLEPARRVSGRSEAAARQPPRPDAGGDPPRPSASGPGRQRVEERV